MNPPDWKPGDRLYNVREKRYGYYRTWLVGEGREVIVVIPDSTGDMKGDEHTATIEVWWDRQDVEKVEHYYVRLM